MTRDTAAERAARAEGMLKHVATRADLERLEIRLYVALTIATGTILAAMWLWT